MGIGTNVQARAVALHELDAPWRPCDIEQRKGRIERQGNQNAQVAVIRYVTASSLDAYSWQTLERKASFIHQVTQGTVDAREIDDVGADALSFAQVKALATGNPLIMEQAGLDSDIARLERLAGAHRREQRDLVARKADMGATATRLEHRAGLCEAAAGRRLDTRGERFAMVVDGEHHRSRVEAGTHLRTVVLALLERSEGGGAPPGASTVAVGRLGGFGIEAVVTRYATGPPDAALRVEDLPLAPLVAERAELARADVTGLVTRLENRVARLDDTAATYRAEAVVARSEVSAMAARIGRPFDHHAELEALRARLVEVNEALTVIDAPLTEVPDETAEAGVALPQSAPGHGTPAVGLGQEPGAALAMPGPHQRHELHTAMYGPVDGGPVLQA